MIAHVYVSFVVAQRNLNSTCADSFIEQVGKSKVNSLRKHTNAKASDMAKELIRSRRWKDLLPDSQDCNLSEISYTDHPASHPKNS